MRISRRDLLSDTAILALAGGSLIAGEADARSAGTGRIPATEVRWLDGEAPAYISGTTFGVPWPRGTLPAGQSFKLTARDGDFPLQSWTLATWPDGSLKWTAHAVSGPVTATNFRLVTGMGPAVKDPVRVKTRADAFVVESGARRWIVPRQGPQLISEGAVGEASVLKGVALTAQCQNRAEIDEGAALRKTAYTGNTETATLEQSGPVRAVIRLEGKHRGGGRNWLPFTVRLYFYAGAETVRIVHTFIFDGDSQKDYICGLGLTAEAPMTDPLYDRHIRFTGQNRGVWGEAVRPVTGLRRDPGLAYRQAQIAGKALPPLTGMDPRVGSRMNLIPAWGDFTLAQTSADGYALRKRTVPGQCWIDAAGGKRAAGLVYAGGAHGGVALGMGDFWQRAPTRLDVRDAAGETAALTAWLWSPEAPAMDLRPYRPVWGMDAHAKENEGLNITYEDYEAKWDTPYGIARTSELMLWTLPATPSHERLADMSDSLTQTPRLMVPPKRLHDADVFGVWGLPDTSTPAKARIEKRLSYLLDFYLGQVEQRHWYGFWNYGDVMHTFDADRHCWRYDIGGFAWDNSELSSDMMFWYGYLRTGRADVFRMAEAMTRHTGEVDVYHLGPWRGFGTRHGVLHFSDSSKQPRVSNAAYRRFYYYLTADERCGDLMHDLIGSDDTLKRVDISRKLAPDREGAPAYRIEGAVDCGFGTSWGSFLAAWLTEWERTGDARWRDRILAGMNSIGAFKRGWFAGMAPYDLKTGAFLGKGDYIGVSHLNCVFGIVEVQYELFDLLDAPEYRKTWLDYCKYYNAPDAELKAFLGEVPNGRSLRNAHSRLTAYAAREFHDKALARRAWQEFYGGDGEYHEPLDPAPRRLQGPDVLEAIDEDASISTNGAAQWSLAAIENLALIGDPPPERNA